MQRQVSSMFLAECDGIIYPAPVLVEFIGLVGTDHTIAIYYSILLAVFRFVQIF